MDGASGAWPVPAGQRGCQSADWRYGTQACAFAPADQMTLGGRMNRILVIGLDGATFRVIDPLMQEGRLPTIQRLVREGTRAVLESTPFPHSAPAWASCLTGVNPGKHGVFGFGVRDEENNYRFQLTNSTCIRVKTLPLLLTEYGKFSGWVNEPLSYPPYRIHGFMIAGLLTPLVAGNYTFPPELKGELLQVIPDYATEVSPGRFNLKDITGKAAYAEALLNSIRVRTKASRFLMRRHSWDAFMVVFTELDRIQHSFWSPMDDSYPSSQGQDRSLESLVSRSYEEIDNALEILLNDLPDKTQVLIVSDHGFGPSARTFYMNRFLEEYGYLKFKVVRRFPSLRSPQSALTRMIQLTQIPRVFPRSKRTETPEIPDGRDPKNFKRKVERWVPEDMVDWSRTKAFADQYGIRINMKGREPKGIIAPGKEAGALMEKLKDQLLQLKYPHNGNRVFEDIQTRDSVYIGPYVDKAPDLITFMEGGFPHPSYRARELFGPLERTRGSHTKEGIFLAWGENTRKGKCLERASIMDITPTICYSLGVPRTLEMDGSVLDIFEAGLDPKRLSERGGTSIREKGDVIPFTSEETSEIEAKLRGLGYLD